MGSALTLMVVLSFSFLLVRLAATVLRLTGLPEPVARFQALSAFTGTGFTTSEAETIVNYPVRRKVVSLAMIVGNLGLVSVLATLVLSFVRVGETAGAVLAQLGWLAAGLALLWFVLLNPVADRAMCQAMSRLLRATTSLGKRRFARLLQVTDGVSVAEHLVQDAWISDRAALVALDLARHGLEALAVRRGDGAVVVHPDEGFELRSGDVLVLFGADAGHESLEDAEKLS
ncbi:MAG: hypothetical protein MI824_07685 [Hyphomicrobiales bacterium]|nr:hypothetical protein [Hyphomicrobiales bacterium]